MRNRPIYTNSYINLISKQTGVSKAKVRAIVDLFGQMLRDDIGNGEFIAIPKLGSFNLSYHPGKSTRHANGITYAAKPHFRVRFKPVEAYSMKIRSLQVPDTVISEHKARKLAQISKDKGE